MEFLRIIKEKVTPGGSVPKPLAEATVTETAIKSRSLIDSQLLQRALNGVAVRLAHNPVLRELAKSRDDFRKALKAPPLPEPLAKPLHAKQPNRLDPDATTIMTATEIANMTRSFLTPEKAREAFESTWKKFAGLHPKEATRILGYHMQGQTAEEAERNPLFLKDLADCDFSLLRRE